MTTMRTPVVDIPWRWADYNCPEDDSRKVAAAVAFHEGQRQQRIQDAWAQRLKEMGMRGYRSHSGWQAKAIVETIEADIAALHRAIISNGVGVHFR